MGFEVGPYSEAMSSDEVDSFVLNSSREETTSLGRHFGNGDMQTGPLQSPEVRFS